MIDGERLKEADLWEEYYTNLHRAYNAMRAAFTKSGLTQDQIATKLGIDKALVSKRLNGTENLTLKSLSFMASAMGCRLVVEPISYQSVGAARLQVHASASKHIAVRTDMNAGFSLGGARCRHMQKRHAAAHISTGDDINRLAKWPHGSLVGNNWNIGTEAQS